MNGNQPNGNHAQNMTEQRINPLLDRIKLPGETFTLPSGGVFYTNGELSDDVSNAEVHVYPMTTIDEITIKTPDLLFSGDAVRSVFGRCIPQIRNVNALLAKDVDFLLICLRKVSYGDQIQLEYTHDCENAKQHTYTIEVNEFIRNSRRIDPTSIASMFNVTLPNGQVVSMQPLRFGDFVKVMQMSDNDNVKDIEKMREMIIESTASIIHSVDGVDDINMIKEWLNGLPPMYFSQINDHVDSTLEWGPGFEVTTTCKDCQQSMVVTAPMNPLYFFT